MQTNESILKWAQENVTQMPGEVHFGEDEIKKYQQVHLAVSSPNGDFADYKKGARLMIAKKAKENGCFYAVDGDDCQDNPSEKSQIFACTGLRPKYDKSLEDKLSVCDFVKLRMSHIDKDEFLRRMGDNPENYNAIDIHVIHEGNPEENYLDSTELKLANRALKKGCAYVTNMYYTTHHPKMRSVSISAKRLIKKK